MTPGSKSREQRDWFLGSCCLMLGKRGTHARECHYDGNNAASTTNTDKNVCATFHFHEQHLQVILHSFSGVIYLRFPGSLRTVTLRNIISAMWHRHSCLCCFLTLSLQGQVTTSQYDNARTGANLNETTLTPQNVNATRFGN